MTRCHPHHCSPRRSNPNVCSTHDGIFNGCEQCSESNEPIIQSNVPPGTSLELLIKELRQNGREGRELRLAICDKAADALEHLRAIVSDLTAKWMRLRCEYVDCDKPGPHDSHSTTGTAAMDDGRDILVRDHESIRP